MNEVRTTRQIADCLGVSISSISTPTGRPGFNKYRTYTKVSTLPDSRRTVSAFNCCESFWEELCGYFALRKNWKAVEAIHRDIFPPEKRLCTVSFRPPRTFIIKLKKNLEVLQDWEKERICKLASFELEKAIKGMSVVSREVE